MHNQTHQTQNPVTARLSKFETRDVTAGHDVYGSRKGAPCLPLNHHRQVIRVQIRGRRTSTDARQAEISRRYLVESRSSERAELGPTLANAVGAENEDGE
ncbi:hypothetical protein ANO11243_072010 [Dothideomycetidae sp. 11243]|nr:hypothetical protein ANO11243_072010 [fungal sp. No.11243]